MKEAVKNQLREALGGKVQFDAPLAPLTSIRIGGPAEALATPDTLDELTAAVAAARRARLPVTVLGAGSNLLVRDGGVPGVVIRLGEGFANFRIEGAGAEVPVIVYTEAGVRVPRLAEWCAEQGLTGIEALIGVPGTVGGAVVMNAGTRDGTIGEVIESVTWLAPSGELRTAPRAKLGFAYRATKLPRDAVVVTARLALRRDEPAAIRARLTRFKDYRRETQPLELPSLGSVFRNPAKQFAGQLIEEAGLKGVRVGGARISPKHGNFIVNEGGATARDVLALLGLAKDKIKEKYGVALEPELKIVGEDPKEPTDDD